MKFKISLLSIIIILVVAHYVGYLPLDRLDKYSNNSDLALNPPVASGDELYKDLFLSLLYPYIDEVIFNYYGESYSHDSEIIKIERPNGGGSLFFVITLEVVPFTGPHISVGVDHITLTVGGSGVVEVVNFQHVKDYELPPHLKNPIP